MIKAIVSDFSRTLIFHKDPNYTGHINAFHEEKMNENENYDVWEYTKIAGILELDPNEIIFVDDVKANIDAANKAGMNGILYENVEEVRKQFNNLL